MATKKDNGKKKKKPYNKGDAYEDKIVELMRLRLILPNTFIRAGAGGGKDALFIHNGKEYSLEIKNGLGADYGQKMLTWNEDDKWTWCRDDIVTQFYTEAGILDYVNKKNIVPRRFTVEKKLITPADKVADQKAFEDRSRSVPGKSLLDYYSLRAVHYMQIGDGFGFYSLDDDPAQLGAKKLDLEFRLRLRCKTIHSNPASNYGFYAVLKILAKPEKSNYNLERRANQTFPPISP